MTTSTPKPWPDYRYTSPDGRRWAALTDDVVESEATPYYSYAQYKRSDLTFRTPAADDCKSWLPLESPYGVDLKHAQAAFDALLPPIDSTRDSAPTLPEPDSRPMQDGDWVRHVLGGRPMQVLQPAWKDARMLQVLWIDDDQNVREAHFYQEDLRHVSPEEQKILAAKGDVR